MNINKLIDILQEYNKTGQENVVIILYEPSIGAHMSIDIKNVFPGLTGIEDRCSYILLRIYAEKAELEYNNFLEYLKTVCGFTIDEQMVSIK